MKEHPTEGKTGWQSALAGMVIGTIVLVLRKQAGLSGFVTNCVLIFLVNRFVGQKDEKILQEFDDVMNEIRNA